MSDTSRKLVELARRLEHLEAMIQGAGESHALQPTRHEKPVAGGATTLVVVREVENDDDPFVWCSLGEVIEATPYYRLLSNDASAIRCEPPTRARHYARFVWEGPTDGFEGTYDWVPGMQLLPTAIIDGTIVVLYRPKIWMRPTPIGTGIKHADCFLTEGGGANLELVYP